MFPGSQNESEPGGHGYGTVVVNRSAAITFSGKLGDGSSVARNAVISKGGLWPYYSSLYSGAGSTLGWLAFTNLAEQDITGTVSWIKRGQPAATLYRSGFANQTQAVGSLYSQTNGMPVVTIPDGEIILQGGNLSDDMTNPAFVAANNTVTSMGAVTLKIAPTRGLFTGSVKPSSGRAISVGGALLQKHNAGYGYFKGTNQTGSVTVRTRD